MKVGVFVCQCGLNIARVIDTKNLVDYVENFASYAKELSYACSDQGQEEIVSAIKEKKLDAVVVAACSPKLHEVTFRRAVARAGLNPYMVEMANIREQCSWVHSDPNAATAKAKDLLRMAIAKVNKNKPLERLKTEINRSVAVIGAGVAGIEAALTIADSGYKVYLIEKRPTIGGHMALLNEVFPTCDCSICILAPRMSDVWKHKNIRVITNAKVEEVSGFVGNFSLKMKKFPRFVDESKCKGCIDDCSKFCPVEVSSEYNFGMGPRKAIYIPFPQSTPLYATIDWENCIGCRLCEKFCQPKAVNFDQKVENIELRVGAIIVATGYKLFDARKVPELGYGRYKNVITLFELERLLSASGPTKGKLLRPSDSTFPKKVAFVLCVGSRDERTNKYCSRVCCMASLKNAYIIKRRHPEVDVTVFYIDIRAFGRMYEEFYRKVQESGVKFIRGRVGEVFETEDKSLILSYEDTLEGEVRSELFDLVVLAVGIEGGNDIAKVFGVNIGEDGFLEVSHPKLRPAETNVKGVFLAGCISGPKDIQDSVASAGLAASKALQLIIEGEAEFDPYFAFVNEDACIGCKMCERSCDFKAVEVNKKAKIDPKACAMCGSCVAACPTGAIDMNFFSNEGVDAMIEALASEKNVDPLILSFCCWYCGYGAADLAGIMKMEYEPNVRIIRVPCAGRVDPDWIIKALELGIDGVLVIGCRLGECHFRTGNLKAKNRIDVLKSFKEIGNRVGYVWLSAGEVGMFVRSVNDFVKKIKELNLAL